jgi:hypothetical protein
MRRVLRIEVTFLSELQRVAERESVWLDVGEGGTVERALALLRERMPAFVGVEVATLVNGAPVGPAQELRRGDGLFLLPKG